MPRKPKPAAPPPGADDPEESQRFIDMAREIGADEGQEGREAFDRTFDKVVRTKVPTSRLKAGRPRRSE